MKRIVIQFFCNSQIDVPWRLCGDAHVYTTLRQFLAYLDRPVTWKGESYELEITQATPQPLLCGQPIPDAPAFVIDRLSVWNDYYSCLAQSTLNSLVGATNCNYTMRHYNKHSTSDVLARAMHPNDHFPTTVLLPESTHLNPEKRSDLLLEVMEKYFNNHYPVFLKRAYGSGGGADVFKVDNFEELYVTYTRSRWSIFHLQEAIENFEDHIRCMAIGPQILPMRFHMGKSLTEKGFPTGDSYLQSYEPNLIVINNENRDIYQRLSNYVKFINFYHRWTYSSFEALIKDNKIHPIDFANPHCDSRFYTLHVHFPWLICALVRWTTFCAVTGKDTGIDMNQKQTLEILNNTSKTAIQKYKYCQHQSEIYFQGNKFTNFCEENWSDIDEKMINFYDFYWPQIIKDAIVISYFPQQMYQYYQTKYQNLMTQYFRPNAKEYLKFNI